MKQRNRKLACLCIAGALLATAGVYQSSQDTENTTTAVAREYAVDNEVTGRQAGISKAIEQVINQPEDDTFAVRAGAVAAVETETKKVDEAAVPMETALNEEAPIEENIHQETAVVDSSGAENIEETPQDIENEEVIKNEETVLNETNENPPEEHPGHTPQENTETQENVETQQNPEETIPEEQAAEPEPEIAIAQVTNYVNVRNMPGEEGEIIGKLYNDSIGTILSQEGDWLKISSGTVEGYVKAEFVICGEEGRTKADEVGTRLARVTTETLRVRQEATTESDIVSLVPQEDVLSVNEEVEGWAKVSAEGKEGYVSTDYVDVYTENTVAESREEEQARLLREEEERRRAEEAARAEQQRAQAAAAAANKPASQAPAKGGGSAPAPSTSGSSMGQNVANYALQFVGNPYVYGGTSLTNGADCSGFIMSVYKNFGVNLPRTSGEQGKSGTDVGGLGNAVPGDLVSYSGHIGIYIGNGQIVHASTAKTGIKISNASYRPILSVRRIV